MTTWVQYHNCDLQGCFPSGLMIGNIDTEKIDIPSIENERGGIYTKKRKAAYESVDNQIFLIIGIGKSKKYFLWSKIFVDEVIPENEGFYRVLGDCVYPKNPIPIDIFDEFNEFKHFCGNFGIGLQNVTNHKFSVTLNQLLSDKLPSKTLDDYVTDISDSTDLIHEINEKMKYVNPLKVNRLVEMTIRNDSKIVKLLKEINNYTCQYPSCNTRIPMKNGKHYIEVAHIKPVAKGGQSIIGNLIVLCPNHHKAFDYGELQILEQDEYHLKGVLNNEQFEIKIKNGW